MSIDFDRSVSVPEDVLVRELEDESVLLNLDSETYYGLDPVGTRMWALLTAAPSVHAAYEALLAEYAVTPEVLHHDVEMLLGQLLDHGLLEFNDV